MKSKSILLALIFLLGCSDDKASSPVSRQPDATKEYDYGIKVGSDYDSAKKDLLEIGWKPVKADCSERNICLEDQELLRVP
jgi:hypothetical protein